MPAPDRRVLVSTDTASTGDWSLGVVAGATMLLGAAVVGYAVLVASASALGAAHLAAVGLSLFLAGLLATQWAGDRFDADAATRRRLSLAFAALAVVLLAAFVVLNYASFEGSVVESGATGTFPLTG
jgi:hypothetical protein